MATRHALPRARLLLGLLTQTSVDPAVADRFDVTCLNGAGDARRLTALPDTRIMPTHVSQMPELISSVAVRVDVVLIRARPAREPGVYRSEERRVGNKCVSTCRSRGSPYH